MIHRELIPFENYTNEFQVPFLIELARALREYVKVTGVKNCFVLEAPIFIPGELKPIQLLFQRKGN